MMLSRPYPQSLPSALLYQFYLHDELVWFPITHFLSPSAVLLAFSLHLWEAWFDRPQLSRLRKARGCILQGRWRASKISPFSQVLITFIQQPTIECVSYIHSCNEPADNRPKVVVLQVQSLFYDGDIYGAGRTEKPREMPDDAIDFPAAVALD